MESDNGIVEAARLRGFRVEHDRRLDQALVSLQIALLGPDVSHRQGVEGGQGFLELPVQITRYGVAVRPALLRVAPVRNRLPRRVLCLPLDIPVNERLPRTQAFDSSASAQHRDRGGNRPVAEPSAHPAPSRRDEHHDWHEDEELASDGKSIGEPEQVGLMDPSGDGKENRPRRLEVRRRRAATAPECQTALTCRGQTNRAAGANRRRLRMRSPSDLGGHGGRPRARSRARPARLRRRCVWAPGERRRSGRGPGQCPAPRSRESWPRLRGRDRARGALVGLEEPARGNPPQSVANRRRHRPDYRHSAVGRKREPSSAFDGQILRTPSSPRVRRRKSVTAVRC